MFKHMFSVIALSLATFVVAPLDASAEEEDLNVTTYAGSSKNDGGSKKKDNNNRARRRAHARKARAKRAAKRKNHSRRAQNGARRQIAGARVQKMMAKTDEILAETQKLVLERGAGEEEYRDAVVAQTAAQQQLAAQKAKLALKLTFEARKSAFVAQRVAERTPVPEMPADPVGPAVVPVEIPDKPAPVEVAKNDVKPAANDADNKAQKGDEEELVIDVDDAVFAVKGESDPDLMAIAAVVDEDDSLDDEVLAAISAAQAAVPEAKDAVKAAVVATPAAPADPAKTAAELAAEAEEYED